MLTPHRNRTLFILLRREEIFKNYQESKREIKGEQLELLN